MLELKKGLTKIANNLGNALRNLGNNNEACESYNKAIAIDSMNRKELIIKILLFTLTSRYVKYTKDRMSRNKPERCSQMNFILCLKKLTLP